MGEAVVDKIDRDRSWREVGGGALIVDDVDSGTVAIADGELRPVGGDVRGDDERVALERKTKDVLDAGFVGPGGGAGVPRPAATAGVLGIGIDVGGDTEGLDLILEDVGQRLGAVDGVDEGVDGATTETQLLSRMTSRTGLLSAG